MKHLRKLLCMILAVVMMSTVLSAMVFAEEKNIIDSGYCGAEGDGSNLKWTLDSEGTLTISGTGAMKSYDQNDSPWQWNNNIKKLVLEEGITSLGDKAFIGCENITGELTIPNSVKELGYWVFAWCKNLSGEIVISENVEKIGINPFVGCTGLTKIILHENNKNFYTDGYILYSADKTMVLFGVNSSEKNGIIINDGVTQICQDAFRECVSIKGELILPSSVKKIERWAFMGCTGLTGDINIPEGTTTVKYNAFCYSGFDGRLIIPSTLKYSGYPPISDCGNIKEIVVSEDNSDYSTDGNILFTKDKTKIIFGINKQGGDLVIPDGVKCIGSNAFLRCDGFTGKVVLPEGLETIEDQAFWQCGFTGDMVIPETVNKIGSFIIDYTNVDKILFKGDAPEVESDSFPEGKTLYYIEGKSGWTSPTWNGYTTATWDPESGETEEPDIIASGYCGAEGDGKNRIWTLDKNGTLTISGTGAMADCSTDLWQNYDLSIKEIAVPNSDSDCSTDGKFLFTKDGTKIIFGINGEWDEDLVIPDGVKCIGFGAFSSRINFTGIVLPDGLERIESKAFWKSSFSGDLVIPETVNYIGHNIFDISLVGYEIEKVIFNGDAPEIETDSFPKEKILYYFNGKSGWTSPTYKGYFTRAINPETGKLEPLVDSVSGYCGAEGDGSNLKWTLTKDGTLTISGMGAMADYQSRISYTRFDKDNSPWRGFADDIKSLVFEEGITRIGDEAFRAFENITGTIVLPESLEEIGNGAFWGCTGITGELVIPSGVKYIGENAFSDMGITGVTIKCEASMNGLSLRSKSIKKITVPESNPVYSTDGNILYDKNKTKVILSMDKAGLIDTIPSSVTTIGEYAFAYHNIGTGGDLVIPNCVKEIEDGAFMSVEGYSGSLIIPESVENIVTGAFSFIDGISNIKVDSKNNNFKAIGNILCSKDGKKLIFGLNINNGVIRIPEGVEVICEAAFCDGMGFVGKLKIPETVTEIGENAFGRCYGIEGIYFEGDAPTVVGYKTSMEWPSFPNITLYYIEGKSGWTSPIWNGYNTATWSGNEDRIPGDINDDGKVDIRDAIRLAKYLAKENVEINLSNANVNGDDKVDVRDLIRLKKYLAKMPVDLIQNTYFCI